VFGLGKEKMSAETLLEIKFNNGVPNDILSNLNKSAHKYGAEVKVEGTKLLVLENGVKPEISLLTILADLAENCTDTKIGLVYINECLKYSTRILTREEEARKTAMQKSNNGTGK